MAANKDLEQQYGRAMEEHGFLPDPENRRYGSMGLCWRHTSQQGGGFFWTYGQQDLYTIKIHDFFFHEDQLLEFHWPESLSVTWYESISGEEFSPCRRLVPGCVKSFIGGREPYRALIHRQIPIVSIGVEITPAYYRDYRRLSAGCIKTYVGGYKPYQVIVHKNIPVRSIGIEITPAYYEDYLKKQYPEVYRNPVEAFREIDQTTDFPEMYRLLSELQSYRGTGIAAKLYYESKVAEALSLVVEYQKKRSVSDHKLASQDLERIQTVAAYLSDHYAGEVPIERLAQIACMGTTKLKSSFKKVYGCTITEYIQQRRMSQAEYLLAHTDLQIGQIAQTIGYSTSSRFAELFRRSTGLLPLEYRKMAKRK